MCIRDRFKGNINFNSDLSFWDVSSVNDMSSMFYNCPNFTSDISEWDVSSVTYMPNMFDLATSFNGDLSNWDVSNVVTLRGMFWNAHSFNSDLSSWDVSSVIDMTKVFRMAHSFNQNISDWDVSNVSEGFVEMFDGANALSEYNKCAIHNSFSINENWSYDWDQFCFIPETIDELQTAVDLWENDYQNALATYGPINDWQVSAVTNMSGLFENKTDFNDQISNWDVSTL